MMTWVEAMGEYIKGPKPTRMKYIITDDRDEFIERLESITKIAFERTGDNLRYLEGMSKIKEVREGAAIEDVFPWIGECNKL